MLVWRLRISPLDIIIGAENNFVEILDSGESEGPLLLIQGHQDLPHHGKKREI